MFGLSWIPNLNFIKSKQSVSRQQKKQMSAVICAGTSNASNQDSSLDAELRWLSTQKNCAKIDYRAVLIDYDHKPGKAEISPNPETHLVFRINAENGDGDLSKQIHYDSAAPENKDQTPRICLACSAENHAEQQTIAYPPYTFHDKMANSHYSMVIDSEPVDIDQLFRNPDFVKWLGVYKPNLLFSREFNNSEYLFYWLIYHIIKADNKVTEGLHNGLSSLFPQDIGGLFNFIFTDGTGAYAYSQIAEIHSGNDAILFRIQRDGHNEYKYILRNSMDGLENDWIHLRPNCLYYFPISGELRYYMFLNSLGNIEVRPGKNRHLGLHFLF